uniref:Uncharacterized protein n=1 Tax=viral metagenome TaxID=1070528 RepID=A0A6M3KE32_9ZZZZ
MGKAEVRYGHVEGPGKGREVPVKAACYFNRQGGKFVRMTEGSASMCATVGNLPAGWLETSKDDAGKAGWNPSSGDVAFMIYANDQDVFEMPAEEGVASLAASQIGLMFRFAMTGATYNLVQKARVANTTASPLEVVDVDTVNRTVKVRVHPRYRQ